MSPSSSFTPFGVPATAAQWLGRGHHCAASGHPDDLRIALDCYDRARDCIGGRATDPEQLRLLGLAWMNRGNMLQSLRRPGDLAAALDAYDASLAAFASLAAHPGIANHVAAAELNRGQTHRRLGNLPAAHADFTRAVHRLEPLLAAGPPDLAPARNAAGATAALAELELAAGAAAAVLSLTPRARDWLAPFAARDLIAATLALDLARLELTARTVNLDHTGLADFTDLLEATLALAVNWRGDRHPTATALAAALFELGATAYADHQPQFLLEFLRDALDPTTGPAPFAGDTTFHAIAAASLRRLRADLARPRALSADDARAHHLLALARSLAAPTPWLRDPAPTPFTP